MRRRVKEGAAVTVADLPPHLKDFDAKAWGWSGPHYGRGDVTGLTVATVCGAAGLVLLMIWFCRSTSGDSRRGGGGSGEPSGH